MNEEAKKIKFLIQKYDPDLIQYILSDKSISDINSFVSVFIDNLLTEFIFTKPFIATYVFPRKSIDPTDMQYFLNILKTNKNILKYYGIQIYQQEITNQLSQLKESIKSNDKKSISQMFAITYWGYIEKTFGLLYLIIYYRDIIYHLFKLKSLSNSTNIASYINKWTSSLIGKLVISRNFKVIYKIVYNQDSLLFSILENSLQSVPSLNEQVQKFIKEDYVTKDNNSPTIISLISYMIFINYIHNNISLDQKIETSYLINIILSKISGFYPSVVIFSLLMYIFYKWQTQYDSFMDLIIDKIDYLIHIAKTLRSDWVENLYEFILLPFYIILHNKKDNVVKGEEELYLDSITQDFLETLNILWETDIEYSFFVKIAIVYYYILYVLLNFSTDNIQDDTLQQQLRQWTLILFYVLLGNEDVVPMLGLYISVKSEKELFFILDTIKEFHQKYPTIFSSSFYKKICSSEWTNYAFFSYINNALLTNIIKTFSSNLRIQLKQYADQGGILEKILYINFLYGVYHPVKKLGTWIELIYKYPEIKEYIEQDLYETISFIKNTDGIKLFDDKFHNYDPLAFLFYIIYTKHKLKDIYIYNITKKIDILQKLLQRLDNIPSVSVSEYLTIYKRNLFNISIKDNNYSLQHFYFLVLVYLFSIDKNAKENANIYAEIYEYLFKNYLKSKDNENLLFYNIFNIFSTNFSLLKNISLDIIANFFLNIINNTNKKWKKAFKEYIENNIANLILKYKNEPFLYYFFFQRLKIFNIYNENDIIQKYSSTPNSSLNLDQLFSLMSILYKEGQISNTQIIHSIVSVILNNMQNKRQRSSFSVNLLIPFFFLTADTLEQGFSFISTVLKTNVLSETHKVHFLYVYLLNIIYNFFKNKDNMPKKYQRILRKGILYLQEKSPTLYYNFLYVLFNFLFQFFSFSVKNQIIALDLHLFPIFQDEVPLPSNKSLYMPLHEIYEQNFTFIEDIIISYYKEYDKLDILYNKKLLRKISNRAEIYKTYELLTLSYLFSNNKEKLKKFLHQHQIPLSEYNLDN